MTKLKYIGVFTLPMTVVISFTQMGIWCFLPVFLFFGLVPLLELLLKPDKYNLEGRALEMAKTDPFYDWLLYLTVPVQVGFLVWFLIVIRETPMGTIEYAGRIHAMGLMCGVFGINIGHELGHRSSRSVQVLGEISLMTSLEMHFLPYHNSGHHHNVATPKDPATARKGEWLYLFWFRSQIGSYIQAWQLETNRLKKKDRYWLSLSNRMVVYTMAQLTLIGIVFMFFDWAGLFAFLQVALMGILLLETVNYIEHYGLLRKKKEHGRYERVLPRHSWNSDHVIGRTFLFELSRHSDHHYKASKHYQILETVQDSPQMPTGYPGMMLLSLLPPLWFWVINRRL
ncbi:MAG: alkane 1-monooxygenase [Saprospiraceae bacterium]|nr:alkane 1-monooxygenase [Saprospiraceae bacterium]MCB9323359.1 alkane 1-monooxygenase [Lewinellaceae bacterium]